jgi:prophage antirepressor-like protein
MGNHLQIFNYSENHVRTVLKDGQPYFVAKDICEILEIGNVTDAVKRLSDSMKGVDSIETLGGKQEVNVITEAGVYKLVFTSRKPEAEKFTDWIASEVLPSIRKHGIYAKEELLDNPDLLLDVITKLKAEREEKKLLQTENKLLTQQRLEWADRKVIEALVKKYGGKIGYEAAWRDFKKELLYSYGINLNLRITNWRNEHGRKTGPKTLDMIHDEEIPACISTAVALCKANGVKIDEIIQKYNVA